MTIDVNGTLGKAVASYVGGRVIELEMELDPQVAGCFGFRAFVKPHAGNAFTIEFLVRGVPLQNVTADDVEEVEFTSWPPEARR